MPSLLVTPVILCGGSGSRLWPLSRSGFPKQFIVLPGEGSKQSLFQQAILRVNAIGSKDNLSGGEIAIGPTLVVTNEEHRFLVLDQLRELNGVKIELLLESIGRNTAPALTLAALQAATLNEYSNDEECDPILVVIPADQVIRDETLFNKALKNCVETVRADYAKKTIAILGITPTFPEVGYGYIKHQGSVGPHQDYLVEKFVEKPDYKTAQSYLNDGCYLWNSGMFVMRASTWLLAIRELSRCIFDSVEAAWIKRTIDHVGGINFIRPDKELFRLSSSDSIDYAVIEKCPSSKFSIKMVELNAGWSDLGSWDAVWRMGKQDENGNLITGDVIAKNSRNSLIYSSGRLVSAVGIENLIIVETADAVLVSNSENSQEVKHVVEQLEAQSRIEQNLHRRVARPWGWFDGLDTGDRFKVKRIEVKPGASLSLQFHKHRAEHWIVVKGVAEVMIGDEVFVLTENQSTYIPIGETHRLSNPGKQLLEIIEVQSGAYLGEDDIVRLDDDYGR